ncbi:MAG: VPDSG-CTERM sorting domain-containing protein [Verrucomicrobiota bacterium]|jgi:hypothetical protein
MKKYSAILAALAATAVSMTAMGDTIQYTHWTSDNLGLGQVYGTLGGVNVTYSGEVAFDQLNNTGTYWYTDPSQVPGSGTEYLNAVVGNTPSTSDMIAITGASVVDTFTFSSPVTDPVMLLVSLGQSGIHTTYTFNTPFTVLSDGPGWWGGPGTLVQSGNALTGIEGDGSIEFVGTYSSISFVGSAPEYWNGFTIGTPVPDGGLTAALLGGALVGLQALRRKM